MECSDCLSMMPDLAVGELTASEESACLAHMAECESCRREMECYRVVIGLIGDEPELAPSASESVALASALDRVPVRSSETVRTSVRSAAEFVGFAAASAAVFVAIAVLLAFQVLGRIDLVSVAGPAGLLRLAVLVAVVLIVTSFLPIAITAGRRPLNGMTFRR